MVCPGSNETEFLRQAEGQRAEVCGRYMRWWLSATASGRSQLALSICSTEIVVEAGACLTRVYFQNAAGCPERYSMNFCVKFNKSASEMIAMIKETYGKDFLFTVQVFR